MKKALLPILMTSVFALTGCHGTKKVTFQEFCDEAGKTEEAPSMKSVKFSGKVDGEKVDFTYEFAKSIGGAVDSLIDVATGKYNKYETAAIALAKANLLSVYTVSEDTSLEYYIGNGFKVKSESLKVEWDKYGLFASYVKGETSVSCSYQKA